MYEINVLRVGTATSSGDAIMARFTRRDTGALAHIVIDAGFQDDGRRLVGLFRDFYGTDVVDLAVVTHPDGDHIGGMGEVVRGLRVQTLAVHRLSQHGGSALRASQAVEDLLHVAAQCGVAGFFEPFASITGFGQALYFAGPSEPYYDQLIQEQLAAEPGRTARAGGGILAGRVTQAAARRLLSLLPEIPFDDAGGDNPRNNSAVVTDLRVDGARILLTSDAGVPALNHAMDELQGAGRADVTPTHVQVPHHGSRHNMDSPTLNRLLGAPGGGRSGWAFVCISEQASMDPRYPSPRVCNGFLRRGYKVALTNRGDMQLRSHDVPVRPGYSPIVPLPPLDESIDDR